MERGTNLTDTIKKLFFCKSIGISSLAIIEWKSFSSYEESYSDSGIYNIFCLTVFLFYRIYLQQ